MKYDSLWANYKVISVRKANITQCLNLQSTQNKPDQDFSRITCSLVKNATLTEQFGSYLNSRIGKDEEKYSWGQGQPGMNKESLSAKAKQNQNQTNQGHV